MPVKNFDLKNRNKFIVNGVVIKGFDDDGQVEYSFDSDEDYAMANGADDITTASRVNNSLGYVEITLKESSEGYAFLLGLIRAQDQLANLGGALLSVSWLHSDLDNGEIVSEKDAVLQTRGMPTKGREAGTRSVKLALPNLKKNYKISGVL